MEFGFERLDIWQNSRILVKDVYQMVAKFCQEEKYGLSDQLRRAVISIPSNIAEGSGRFSIKEKIHFTEIAYGSLMEVVCQTILAVDLGLATEIDKEQILIKAELLKRQLSAYRRSLFNQLTPKPQNLNPLPKP